jgi:hypothetical protein
MRLIQGLALGGEYGGAATYVAEHAPPGRARPLHLLHPDHGDGGPVAVSLIVILGVRTRIGEEAFADWGWRIPFLVSILLLGVSLWIRLRLDESPAFQRMKDEGKGSKHAPEGQLPEVAQPEAGADRAVRPDRRPGGGLVHGPVLRPVLPREDAEGRRGPDQHPGGRSPCCWPRPSSSFWGWLSDRIGRKPIILVGCLIAALTYGPLFHALTAAANPPWPRRQLGPGDGPSPIPPLRLPVRPGRQDRVHQLLRPGQVTWLARRACPTPRSRPCLPAPSPTVHRRTQVVTSFEGAPSGDPEAFGAEQKAGARPWPPPWPPSRLSGQGRQRPGQQAAGGRRPVPALML